MTLGTRLFTWFNGERVGSDSFGNQYYREKKRRPLVKGGGFNSRERRWVIYSGRAEATKVPAEWHGWLHHTVDTVPQPGTVSRRPWQKEHQPNLTGTINAYRPRGSVLRDGHRPKSSGDYEPWVPN